MSKEFTDQGTTTDTNTETQISQQENKELMESNTIPVSSGSMIYMLPNGEEIIARQPPVIGNNFSLVDMSAGLEYYTYSKSKEYNIALRLKISIYGQLSDNIKSVHLIIKENELPSNINDGIEILTFTSDVYLSSSNLLLSVDYKNKLKPLKNGKYYPRIFAKDINNVCSIDGGLFTTDVESNIIPYILITD